MLAPFSSRYSMILYLLFALATCSGVWKFLFRLLIVAWLLMRIWNFKHWTDNIGFYRNLLTSTISRLPTVQATCRGYMVSSLQWLTSAPFSTRIWNVILSVWCIHWSSLLLHFHSCHFQHTQGGVCFDHHLHGWGNQEHPQIQICLPCALE